VPIVLKSGRLSLPETSGLVQACNGIDIPLSINSNTIQASAQVPNKVNRLKTCAKRWSMKANQSKATFTTRSNPYKQVFAENAPLPNTTDSKYLRLCPDRRLKWRKHDVLKGQELSLRIRQIYKLLGKKLPVSKDDNFYSLQNNLKIYVHTLYKSGDVLNPPTDTSSNYLTLRRLMSCIYGAPILDVSKSHTTTQHSR